MSFDADFMDRLLTRLDPLDSLTRHAVPTWTDLNAAAAPLDAAQREAAVLVPIVERPEGLAMLLTLRSASMPTHAGQVSFPGGRIQPEDAGPLAAALRETHEEVGIAARFVSPVGGYGRYLSGTNFSVTPIVGLVAPGFDLAPDPREVDAVFETPVSFLMDVANHQRHAREYNGVRREFYAMPWEDRYIWGLTAGMIRALYARLYEDA